MVTFRDKYYGHYLMCMDFLQTGYYLKRINTIALGQK